MIKKKVLLVGNPNVGKSLIFNGLTGRHQKIGNYPGVTLTHLSGNYSFSDKEIEVIDLPGLYSFNSGNIEEGISHEFIIDNQVDLLINIIDGRRLERNLFLTVQLRAMGIPILAVITFKDKIKSSINLKKLSEKLDMPFLRVSSHEKDDIINLKKKIDVLVSEVSVLSDLILPLNGYEDLIHSISNELDSTILLQKDNLIEKVPSRWIVISVLMNNRDTHNLWPAWIISKIHGILEERSMDHEKISIGLISKYYEIIENVLEETIILDEENSSITITEKIDRLLLDSRIGFVIFAIIMFAVFKITFDVSAPISNGLDLLANLLADSVKSNISNKLFASFIADALIGGVGFILLFIPQIALLFLFISIMEHSGYLARVVFIFDRFLNRIGISGTSIAPLLLGFGCNVPAIMATKSINDHNERTALILVNPFMSCSARLPVYVVITAAIFPEFAGIMIAILYFTGIFIAILVLFILRKTILKGDTTYLLMELPEMSIPPARLTLSRMWLQVKKFAENAASWMALGLIIMWILSITGPKGYIGPDALTDTQLLQRTFIFMLGDIFQPIFQPFAWDARLIVALIFGFIAKEIVISSLGLIYGVSEGTLNAVIISQLSPASGLAFLFFVLLYTPCIGTLFAIKQEIGRKWVIFSILMGLVVAYTVAYIAFIIGSAIF